MPSEDVSTAGEPKLKETLCRQVRSTLHKKTTLHKSGAGIFTISIRCVAKKLNRIMFKFALADVNTHLDFRSLALSASICSMQPERSTAVLRDARNDNSVAEDVYIKPLIALVRD